MRKPKVHFSLGGPHVRCGRLRDETTHDTLDPDRVTCGHCLKGLEADRKALGTTTQE